MLHRPLGATGITMAPLVFGGNVFGWTLDEKKSFELLDAFSAAGFSFIDTADTYSRWVPGHEGGESETIIGRWIKQRGNRDKVIISTKVGGDMGQGKKDLSQKHILRSVESSLSRLQTDYIDLYQSHYDDPDTPIEETLETYAQLVKAGKVRFIGASNFAPQRLVRSLEMSQHFSFPLYCTLQPLYNLYDRDAFEKELAPICIEHSVGVIPYSSLASGFLSGKYRQEKDLGKSVRGNGIKGKYLNERGLRILKALDEVAETTRSSPASVAIAWLLSRPGISAPIASATSLEQLDALISATQLQLGAQALVLLERASANN